MPCQIPPIGSSDMTQTELLLSFAAVAMLAYAVGVQQAAKKQFAATHNQPEPDPLAWLGSWAQQ